MRPSDITDGIPSGRLHVMGSGYCFNEAVGYYRRNLRPVDRIGRSVQPGFNEAVGYYRRNRSGSGYPGRGCRRFNEAVGYYRRNLNADASYMAADAKGLQ